MTTIIDGKMVSDSILSELSKEIEPLEKKPGLAVILVGNNPASKTYIGMKKKVCAKIGIQSFEFLLPENSNESELESLIESLNERDEVNGILLQVPLPKGFNEQRMLELIDPKKDVDGFHPVNVGKPLIGLDTFKSCTPYGIYELLKRYKIQ